jgi:transposase-like protein
MSHDSQKELVLRVLAVAEAVAQKEAGGGLDKRGAARVVAKAFGVDEGLISRWRKAAKEDSGWSNVRSDVLERVAAAASKYSIPFETGVRARKTVLVQPVTEAAEETVPALLLEYLSSGRGGNVTPDERAALRTFLTGSHAWEGGPKLEHLDRALRMYRGRPEAVPDAKDQEADDRNAAKGLRKFGATAPAGPKKR